MTSKHTPGPRGRSATDQQTIDGYRDLAVRDARTIADLAESEANLVATLQALLPSLPAGDQDIARAAIARAKGETK